jgi:hypothetical protein
MRSARGQELYDWTQFIIPKRDWTWNYGNHATRLYRKLKRCVHLCLSFIKWPGCPDKVTYLKRCAHLQCVCFSFTRWLGCTDKMTCLILSGRTAATSVQTLYNSFLQRLSLFTVPNYHLIWRYMALMALQNNGTNSFHVYANIMDFGRF